MDFTPELPASDPNKPERKQPAIVPANVTNILGLRTRPREKPVKGLQRDWHVIPSVGYRFEIKDFVTTFDVKRIRTKFDEIWGLLTVRTRLPGARVVADNILSSGDFSFSNVRARGERAKELQIRSCENEIDWRGLIEELCLNVLAHEERGEPECLLSEVVMPEKEWNPEVWAGGMPILRKHPVIWFGDGGTAKSLLAMYAAIDLAQSGYKVLYLDWELDEGEHRHRMDQLLDGQARNLDTLFYRRCERPLVDDVLRVRDIVATRNIEFMFCDSLSWAAKPPIESSESALTYQQALRSLGPLGSVHIAHMNRSENGDQRPFGSAYWHNMARSTWFLKRNENTQQSNEITVGCYNRKANLGEVRPAFAHRITFTRESIVIGPGDLADDPELVKKLALVEKIALALRNGPQTEALLADECEAKIETVSRTLRRHKSRFDRTLGDDGIARVRLINRAV